MQTWEGAYARPWDVLEEDEEGGLQSTVEKLLAKGRRRRYVQVFNLDAFRLTVQSFGIGNAITEVDHSTYVHHTGSIGINDG